MVPYEITINSVKVNTDFGKTAVFKYTDENGTYFYDENLEKQYIHLDLFKPLNTKKP